MDDELEQAQAVLWGLGGMRTGLICSGGDLYEEPCQTEIIVDADGGRCPRCFRFYPSLSLVGGQIVYEPQRLYE